MAGSIIGGIVSLAVVAIVFAQVLMPILVTGLNATYTTSAGVFTTNASAVTLWSTSQIISVVGFIFVLLAVFGVAV
jgi:hypothetical protein